MDDIIIEDGYHMVSDPTQPNPITEADEGPGKPSGEEVLKAIEEAGIL